MPRNNSRLPYLELNRAVGMESVLVRVSRSPWWHQV